MKYFNIAFILILNIILFEACKKENSLKVDNTNDCFFEQIDDNVDGFIDETERATMNECSSNLLTSKSEIERNLIGEWKLVGHAEGWLPIFEFKNAETDTVTTHSWEIEAINSTGDFRLNILPEYVEGLFVTQFCTNFMYGDATPSDGNMYLYEKVE